jgi:hypothetical protein
MSTLLVVIFVAAGEAGHPATQVAASAARELLGAEHEVEVREIDAVPDDDRASSIGSALHAGAVVELVWEGPEHRQVRIRVHVEPRPGYRDRLLTFSDTDELSERGRTVGYAIAANITAPQESPTPPLEAPIQPEVPPVSVPISPPVPRARAFAHGTLDVTATGAMGINGPAGGWGGTLSGRWYFAPPWALRAGTSARLGQVTPAQATSLLMHAAAGIAWLPLPATVNRPFELGARVDGLLLREQLNHFDSDDEEPAIAMRWLPGADAALEGTWLFGSSTGLLASLGAEFAFGRTNVTIERKIVTTIPPVRLVLQAGVRASF